MLEASAKRLPLLRQALGSNRGHRSKLRSGVRPTDAARLFGRRIQSTGKRDFDLLVSHAELETDAKAFERLVQNGKVDGFILMRTLQQDPRAEWLIDNRIPFVTHGRTSQSHRHAWFDMDGAWAMKTACQNLVDIGHEKIAFVQAPDHYAFAKDRAQGALNHTDLAVMASADEAGGYRAARELFESPTAPCPTAVVCISTLKRLALPTG